MCIRLLYVEWFLFFEDISDIYLSIGIIQNIVSDIICLDVLILDGTHKPSISGNHTPPLNHLFDTFLFTLFLVHFSVAHVEFYVLSKFVFQH